ncbi:hypothetical protein RB195_004835 [Necator americanus]
MMGTWYFPGPDGRFHPQDERTMDPHTRAYLEAVYARMNSFNIGEQSNNGTFYSNVQYNNAAYYGIGGYVPDDYYKAFRRVFNDADMSNESYYDSATDTDSDADFDDDDDADDNENGNSKKDNGHSNQN